MMKSRHLVVPFKTKVSLRGGGRIFVDISDHIQRQIYFLGHYEARITDLLSRLLIPGSTFIDVGANVGYHTIVSGLLVGPTGSVHSFEPVPKIFAALETNVALNNLPHVYLNQAAVYSTDGDLEIYLPGEGNSGLGSMVRRPHPYHSGSALLTSAVSLDSYVLTMGIERIRVIKLDIEGAEIFAMRGMESILSSSNAPDLICEADTELLSGAGHSSEDLVQFMERFGYQVGNIDDWHLHFSKESI